MNAKSFAYIICMAQDLCDVHLIAISYMLKTLSHFPMFHACCLMLHILKEKLKKMEMIDIDDAKHLSSLP